MPERPSKPIWMQPNYDLEFGKIREHNNEDLSSQTTEHNGDRHLAQEALAEEAGPSTESANDQDFIMELMLGHK